MLRRAAREHGKRPGSDSDVDSRQGHRCVYNESVWSDHLSAIDPNGANPAGESAHAASAGTLSVNGLSKPLPTRNPSLNVNHVGHAPIGRTSVVPPCRGLPNDWATASPTPARR